MSVIKGFFFDLDGTLVNTHESNFRAYSSAIKKVTGYVVGDDLRDLIKEGENSEVFLRKIVPSADAEMVKVINAEKKIAYPDHIESTILNVLLTGFLQSVSNSHHTVLVTTAKRANALAVLHHYELDSLFSDMIFGEDVEKMKPNAEAYLLALKRTGLKPDEAIAFEDSHRGLEAAQAAGLSVIHVRDFHD